MSQKLRNWRDKTALKEGVDSFRVLSNATIKLIAEMKPQNEEELISIKGIKQRKFDKYGQNLLAIINDCSVSEAEGVNDASSQNTCSISQYFILINSGLRKYQARILAEVSSLDVRDTYIFFSLKDKVDDSVLPCFMWRRDYEVCGMSLEVGMEIIAEGFPSIYERAGRFSFQTKTIELVGEGALKVAYDKLRIKLSKEGLFDTSKKRDIPDFPQKIGVITSKQGAVISDFLNNLGKHGYQISLIDSRVEGLRAVKNLLSALNRFEREDLDILVIIRGGGSMESMMAFDNEVLVRKIVNYPIPVIAGIGHHKDVPLLALVADAMPSTPTAAAHILNRSWIEASNNFNNNRCTIVSSFERMLNGKEKELDRMVSLIYGCFNDIFRRFSGLKNKIRESLLKIGYQLATIKKENKRSWQSITVGLENIIGRSRGEENSLWQHYIRNGFSGLIIRASEKIRNNETIIRHNDPHRQLSLGYSIARKDGRVIRVANETLPGQKINIELLNGSFDSEIIRINN